MNDRRILGEIFSLTLTNTASSSELAKRTGEGTKNVARRLSSLKAKGLVERHGSRLRLTEKGRKRVKVVFIGGSFELIHPGHLHTIVQAKKLGDVLVVVVARDSTIRRRKGREPISSEKDRLSLLASVRAVDAAILGVEGNIYESLERVKPDVVALGYDQYHAEGEIEREAERRGMRLKVVRLGAISPEIKTSKILADLA
ncbi:MAG: adenylyltransferase/cytidyltransferase family protein [Nitrososphaerales archaeon]|nr:adenylyltransferase/cytidyltransferase family protein [Nitrososphaerales archaeon]